MNEKTFILLILVIVGVIALPYTNTRAQDSLIIETFTVEDQTGDCGISKSDNCAHIKLEYFKVEIPSNKQAQKKINLFMKNRMLASVVGEENSENVDQLIKEYLDEYKKFKREFPDSWQQWEVERTAEIVFQDENILAADIHEYSFLGGAHPNSYLNFYNFNLSTGELIKLSDLFIDGYETELNKVAESIFRKEKGISRNVDMSKSGYWFKDNKFSVNNNFLLNDEGILFYYNSYEIAPYAVGPTRIFIPYENIKHIIDNRSVVSDFISE